jgi:hypothetical protein
MKQTAVEWLVEQITLPELGDNPQWVQDAIEQAKEMEKDQIIDGIVQKMMNELNIYSEVGILNLVKQAEQYYNETFKSE